MPADVGQAAVARAAPPLRTVTVEATVLQDAPGVTAQVWGPQIHRRVGESMWWVERAMAITGPARTPTRRGWLSSLSLSRQPQKENREKFITSGNAAGLGGWGWMLGSPGPRCRLPG